MFDLSLAEFGVIGVVALMMLGPDEMVKVISFIRKAIAYLKNESSKYINELNEATGHDELVKVIFDDDGLPQKGYDLEKIKPILRKPDA